MKNNIKDLLLQFKANEINIDQTVDGIFDLFTVKNRTFLTAKKGDYLLCTKVYPQSKKYTVGKTYQVLGIERGKDYWNDDKYYLLLRCDRNRLTRIDIKNGISFTDFKLISNR